MYFEPVVQKYEEVGVISWPAVLHQGHQVNPAHDCVLQADVSSKNSS